MAVKTAKIEKIYFMIHPTCWADGGSPQEGYLEETGYNASDWYVSLNWEKEVNQKQKEFISNMGPGEAMVIIPINHDAPSAQMRDLWDHAERCLGRRSGPRLAVRANQTMHHRRRQPCRRWSCATDREVQRGSLVSASTNPFTIDLCIANAIHRRRIALRFQAEFSEIGI